MLNLPTVNDCWDLITPQEGDDMASLLLMLWRRSHPEYDKRLKENIRSRQYINKYYAIKATWSDIMTAQFIMESGRRWLPCRNKTWLLAQLALFKRSLPELTRQRSHIPLWLLRAFCWKHGLTKQAPWWRLLAWVLFGYERKAVRHGRVHAQSAQVQS